MEEKLCCKCRKAPAGDRGLCAECRRNYYRGYYAANKERILAQGRERRKRRLAEMSEAELATYREAQRERIRCFRLTHLEYSTKRRDYARKFFQEHPDYSRQHYLKTHPQAAFSKDELWRRYRILLDAFERLTGGGLSNAALPSDVLKMINDTLEAIGAGKES